MFLDKPFIFKGFRCAGYIYIYIKYIVHIQKNK